MRAAQDVPQLLQPLHLLLHPALALLLLRFEARVQRVEVAQHLLPPPALPLQVSCANLVDGTAG